MSYNWDRAPSLWERHGTGFIVTAAIALVALIVFVMLPTESAAQIGRAPDGETAEVAQHVIRKNFSSEDCPLVVDARRLGDGSIIAECNNAERFRVFSFNGREVAMRCSAVQLLGISGC